MVTLGLLRAFARAGVAVAACKNGPDYIDPAFHAAATGRDSLNLDTWAMPPALVGALARRASAGADLLIGEGSMGLFDGVVAPEGETGATADLAARLGLPVLLVLDVSGQSQTAAAIVAGCAALDRRVRIGGVILNRVASERHRRLRLRSSGDAGCGRPERGSGLVAAGRGRGRGPAAVRGSLRSLDDFRAAGLLPPGPDALLEEVADRYAVSVSPAMAALIDPTDPQDPIALQFVPQAAERDQTPDERADPIGDAVHSPVPGIVHRYPDRVLLTLLYVCPVYCRFCFRRERVGPGHDAVSGTPATPRRLSATSPSIRPSGR